VLRVVLMCRTDCCTAAPFSCDCRYAVVMTQSQRSPRPRYLLIGATGAVGRHVLERLTAHGEVVLALSRHAHAPAPKLAQWHRHDVYRDDPNTLPAAAVVIGAGPLDGLAIWAARAHWPAATRLVALSSLSAESKAESDDADERALAQRLRDAEATLFAVGKARGWLVTLVRASLIYDPQFAHLSLDRLLALANRLRCLPLPRDATGLRQPVHADDLAQALLACVARDATAGTLLRLAGGEAVPFADMVLRYLRAHGSTAPIVWLPVAAVSVLHALLPLLGRRGRSVAAPLARSRQSLAIDNADWLRVGLVPCAFVGAKANGND